MHHPLGQVCCVVQYCQRWFIWVLKALRLGIVVYSRCQDLVSKPEKPLPYAYFEIWV